MGLVGTCTCEKGGEERLELGGDGGGGGPCWCGGPC